MINARRAGEVDPANSGRYQTPSRQVTKPRRRAWHDETLFANIAFTDRSLTHGPFVSGVGLQTFEKWRMPFLGPPEFIKQSESAVTELSEIDPELHQEIMRFNQLLFWYTEKHVIEDRCCKM